MYLTSNDLIIFLWNVLQTPVRGGTGAVLTVDRFCGQVFSSVYSDDVPQSSGVTSKASTFRSSTWYWIITITRADPKEGSPAYSVAGFSIFHSLNIMHGFIIHMRLLNVAATKQINSKECTVYAPCVGVIYWYSNWSFTFDCSCILPQALSQVPSSSDSTRTATWWTSTSADFTWPTSCSRRATGRIHWSPGQTLTRRTRSLLLHRLRLQRPAASPRSSEVPSRRLPVLSRAASTKAGILNDMTMTRWLRVEHQTRRRELYRDLTARILSYFYFIRTS